MFDPSVRKTHLVRYHCVGCRMHGSMVYYKVGEATSGIFVARRHLEFAVPMQIEEQIVKIVLGANANIEEFAQNNHSSFMTCTLTFKRSESGHEILFWTEQVPSNGQEITRANTEPQMVLVIAR